MRNSSAAMRELPVLPSVSRERAVLDAQPNPTYEVWLGMKTAMPQPESQEVSELCTRSGSRRSSATAAGWTYILWPPLVFGGTALVSRQVSDDAYLWVSERGTREFAKSNKQGCIPRLRTLEEMADLKRAGHSITASWGGMYPFPFNRRLGVRQ